MEKKLSRELTSRRLLTPEELAELVGVSPGTLRGWRDRRSGPRAVKAGGLWRYREVDVIAWLDTLEDGSDDSG